MTLTDLLMLAEKATAGSRELDYAIAEWFASRSHPPSAFGGHR